MNTEHYEFWIGEDASPAMRVPPGLHFKIGRNALLKVNGGFGRALGLDELYRMNQWRLDKIARALVEANPDAPRPLEILPEHL